jgi:hypothetical protein
VERDVTWSCVAGRIEWKVSTLRQSYWRPLMSVSPTLPFHLGDIRTFELGHQFDVVTCLFATIGYARTTAGLRVALTQLASHVADAGLLLVEPWLAPTVPWHFAEAFAEDPHRLVARVGRGWTEGGLSVSDTDYLVVEDGAAEHFRERHELGLFDEADYDAAFRAAGLAVERATRDSSSVRLPRRETRRSGAMSARAADGSRGRPRTARAALPHECLVDSLKSYRSQLVEPTGGGAPPQLEHGLDTPRPDVEERPATVNRIGNRPPPDLPPFPLPSCTQCLRASHPTR